MRPSSPSRTNKAGRDVWFAHAEDGALRPVSKQGVLAFVLASVFVIAGGTAMMLGLALSQSPLWIPAMFAAVTCGLGVFALVASRHLP